MTDEEALALRPGDVVEVRLANERYLAEVSHTHQSLGCVWASVFRLGRTRAGGRYPRMPRDAWCLHPVGKPLEPGRRLVANIFADWLDDHDEPRAAAKLREAFPVIEDPS